MKIALIGFTSELFLPFGRALEKAGFGVYWVHSLHSFTRYLLANGVARTSILDLSNPSDWRNIDAAAIADLRTLEQPDLPRINSIVLMDRLLRCKPYEFATAYLAHSARALREFLLRNNIECLASGRDTALQLLSLLVARATGVTWSGTTYMRLPKERFMFTTTHETDELYPLGTVSARSREEARAFLREFRAGALRPYVRPSSPSWGGVLRRFPIHLREGWRLLRKTRFDRGNDFARYTLPALGRMWLRKKLNLLQCQLFVKMHQQPSGRPYLFFGLHRQPESSIDVLGAYYSDQRYLVQTIARSMPFGHELLVKLHVSDADGWPASFLHELASFPGVRLIDPLADSRRLLEGAALTITNSGTMAFEAGLLGRPAITFSRVHFNVLPTVHYCPSGVALPGLIDQALRRQPQPDDAERIERILSEFFAHSFPGMPNRAVLHSELTPDDLQSLATAYLALYRYRCQALDRRSAGAG